MSNFNKKGYTSIPAKDPKSGEVHRIAVKIGSPVHKRYMRGLKQWQKARKENNRNFKAMLKTTKKLQREEQQIRGAADLEIIVDESAE